MRYAAEAFFVWLVIFCTGCALLIPKNSDSVPLGLLLGVGSVLVANIYYEWRADNA